MMPSPVVVAETKERSMATMCRVIATNRRGLEPATSPRYRRDKNSAELIIPHSKILESPLLRLPAVLR